ncbi:peptidylprolyl isomerase [Achlya hypogyna]|uniref:peptidylprolyl isomerase n=2 Tax=Achlya hypogyna TaxID=1202772 RepID=A0A1V9Z5R9_ACHHY|nr:peptidylprolyl isomerase [Achlya hypogyna]
MMNAYEPVNATSPRGGAKPAPAYPRLDRDWRRRWVLVLPVLGVLALLFNVLSGSAEEVAKPSAAALLQTALDTNSVVVEALLPGDGVTFPKKGDSLTVHYAGRLASNMKLFDSSYARSSPFVFNLDEGMVIAGWDQGLAQMSLNETANLYIPSALGYGETGAGRDIPPNADLIFEVYLVAINGESVAAPVPSELQVTVLTPGDGKTYPKRGDTVTVHYVGTFTDGKQFDSSRSSNRPFSFTVGQNRVIKGWEQGIPQLSLGEKASIYIPYALAYGEKGRAGIPPKADLIFEVELLKITPP